MMASYTVTTAKHATLTANTVDTVTFTTDASVEVFNRGSDYIYFTTDTTTPTVAGDNALVVPPGGALSVSGGNYSDGITTVKLIAATSCAYSVTTI
jgi:hypothetical protein